jgi:predicted nucleic-acid-binding Zn-ribbon protein
MNEEKNGFIKCSRCGEEMKEAHELFGYAGVTIVSKNPYSVDRVVPFYCKNCGYIELYKKNELTNFLDKNQQKSEKP